MSIGDMLALWFVLDLFLLWLALNWYLRVSDEIEDQRVEIERLRSRLAYSETHCPMCGKRIEVVSGRRV